MPLNEWSDTPIFIKWPGFKKEILLVELQNIILKI
jgi:hypothetical protein